MGIAEARRATAGVEGWLTDSEGELLYELARRCTGRGVIVEIGSWKGKSTIWLGSGSRDGAGVKVVAVDPHTGSPEHHDWYGKVNTLDEFRRNVDAAGLSSLVSPLVLTSAEAAKTFSEPVELVFIDGAHEYEAVREDLELWLPRVVEGGTVALHDTMFWSGPKRVVRELVAGSPNFRELGFADTITYARKVQGSTGGDRLRSRLFLVRKEAAEFRSNPGQWLKGQVPAPLKRAGKRLLGRGAPG